MDIKTQPIPGYYVWDVPSQPAVIYLSLETLDRLEAEILRGFGAIPNRGAEVGGVLLGAVEDGAAPDGRTVVRIRDFEPVGCSYKNGPKYTLDEGESRTFQETCEHWKSHPSRALEAVGYYRSHTREESRLDAEDVTRMNRFFPQWEAVALLVRAFAGKPSVGGFFVREDGAFPSATPLEFPFRRKELTGIEPAPRQSVFERPAATSAPEAGSEPQESAGVERMIRRHGPPGTATPAAEPDLESASKFRASWVWLPLSFVFLLLGVFLGFQLALGLGPRGAASAAGTDFSLGLTVTRAEDNLSVRWNRSAPAIRSAQKGLLEIEDGGYAKPVDLDQAHLQNGSIIYRHSSNTVRFRLIVYENTRLTVTETLEWRQ
jgi:hypothetical protein